MKRKVSLGTVLGAGTLGFAILLIVGVNPLVAALVGYLVVGGATIVILGGAG